MLVVWWSVLTLVKFFLLLIPVLLSVAFLTLFERKVLASMQRRRGPNFVGLLGTFQPLADALKLLAKETVLPNVANSILFFFSPVLLFFLSLLSWTVIPFFEGVVISDFSLGLLFIFMFSSLGVYSIILAGWASNSKYSFLGSLRSAAQIISYEVSIGLILLSLFISVGSLNLTRLVMFQYYVPFIIPYFPLFFLFFVSVLAETNRSPFDLPEAEAELVSGYNVEYSAVGFALFFIAEYSSIILISVLVTILFFGGWIFLLVSGPLFYFFKVLFVLFGFIWIRAAFPRYRYDQLIRLGWKVFLPISLGWMFFSASILISFGSCPSFF
jgi:NADH-quinone oxidoreductase subunit H